MSPLDALLAFLTAHNYSAVFLVVVALAGWGVVRLLKSDTKIPITIPPRWRPILALGFGAAAGAIYKAATDGVDWKQGLLLGLSAGVGSILVQVFAVDVARNGRDIPVPKAMSIRPPPPPPADSADSTSPVDVPRFPRPPSALRVLALAAALPLAVGCTQLHDAVPVLNDVITYVTDAEQILAALETVANLFMSKAPNDAQEQYALLDDHVHRSLDACVRLARAGKELDSAEMQAAIADFQGAYNDLEGFLAKNGVHAGAAPGKMGATGPRDVPLLMSVHAKGAR